MARYGPPPDNDPVPGLLALRALYDGDLIDYPIDENHPQRWVFDDLERRGLVTRWRRLWPLRHRYRLTEAGIAELEKHYDPSNADAHYRRMREEGVREDEREDWLYRHGMNPWIWPALHDHGAHWSTWHDDHGARHRYVHPHPTAPPVVPDPGPAVQDLDDEAGRHLHGPQIAGVSSVDLS